MSDTSAFPRNSLADAFPEENPEMEGGMVMTSVDMTIRREVTGNFMEALQCIYCTKILQAPISVCGNGHSCCGDCRTKINVCGMCRGQFVSSSNRLVENLLRTCATRCDFSQLGCPEIVMLDKFEDHLAECVHNPNPPLPEPEPEPESEFRMENRGPEPDPLEAEISLLQGELDYMEERMADAERSTSDILIRLSVSSPSTLTTMARNEAPHRNRNDYHPELAGAGIRLANQSLYLPPRHRAPSSFQRAMERFRDVQRTLRPSFAEPSLFHLHSSSAQVLPEIPSVQPVTSTLPGLSGPSTEYRSSFLNRSLRPGSAHSGLSPPRFRRPARPYYHGSWNTRQEDSDFPQFVARPVGRNLPFSSPWRNPQQRHENMVPPARHESFYSGDPNEDFRDEWDTVFND